jgi:hypothetical protein
MRRKADQALDIPDHVVEQLKARNIAPNSQAAMQRVYEGMFTRIARACPVDYYWIWGHEGDIEEQVFIDDLRAANAARRQVNAPFELGVCGWGWTAAHFPGLDKALPKELFFSAINASVGSVPVSENFGKLGNRPRWAIPWFENDGHMTSLQLRAGRMRRDAVDARRYGCTGLMGIFWRTRILSPNIAALAQAGWEQGAWSRPSAVKGEKRDVEVIGGQTATFLNNAVAGTDNDPIYQTIRFNLRGYRFTAPNGKYKVTLRFVEPSYKEAGKRVFGVKLQDRPVIEHLDIFAAAGQFKALNKTFPNIAVTDGVLRIDFISEVEYPCIAAIEVTGNGMTRKINCGGPAYQDYAADASSEKLPRDLPIGDFYADWATAQFGREVGPAAAAVFTKLDGHFPAPSGWIRGPGAIIVNKQPWAKVAPQYAFVDQFAALRPRVKGAGNLERFDWWLNTFRVTKFMGQFGCARGELDAIMANINKLKALGQQRKLARERALPVRLRMVTLLGELHNALLATLHNATELGTLCNIEQQSMLRLKLLTGHDAALEKLLGQPLPATARPWKDYRGTPRLVVMNARTMAHAGEALTLDIIALDKQPVKSVAVRVRPLGQGDWQIVPATHVARAVYAAKLPAVTEDFEYHVTAGDKLIWPATAPTINQTVVVIPATN